MTTNQMFMNDTESPNRPAWTQTLEQGMGSGLQASKHKQPHNGSGLKRDYYVKSKGCK